MKCKVIAMTILLLIVGIIGIEPLLCETLAEPPSNYGEPDAGTEENPFLIANLANLRWLSETYEVWGNAYLDRQYHFLQTADIDASETIHWYDGYGLKGFMPIGRDAGFMLNPFSGQYDGNHKTIKNVHITTSLAGLGESYDPSLFYRVISGTIKNVRVENIYGTYETDYWFGRLVEWAEDSSIISCSIMNGGLISIAYDVLIENCYVTGQVDRLYPDVISGNAAIGGLVDQAYGTTVRNSFFNGSIISKNEQPFLGGLIGGAANSIVQHCYVTSSSEFVNIAGLIDAIRNTTVTNSFWDIEITGTINPFNQILGENNIVTNVFGKTTTEMKQASTYTYSGWDFENIWTIDPNVNNGYPFLRNMPEPVLSGSDNTIVPLVRSVVYPNPVRGDDITFKLTSNVGDTSYSSHIHGGSKGLNLTH